MAYFFWAAFLTLLTVVVHALGIFCINRLTHFMIGRIRVSAFSETVLFGVVTYLLMLVHMGPVLLWALFYWHTAGMESFSNAFFYSISSYSTVGLADHGPAGTLGRLLGPYESALGMLMFGLSGAYLVHVRELTREQAKAAARLL